MSSRDQQDGGLEELFGLPEQPVPAEEPPPEAGPRPRSTLGWVLRNVALVAGATVVTVAGLRIAGIRVPLLLIIAAFLALRLLMFAVAEVAPPPRPDPQSRRGEESGAYGGAGSDSLRAAVRRWERSLDWSQSDPGRFSRNVLPVLTELTDERLRLRHGITRATDPRRARELLGEPLWALLDDPGARPPKARDLAGHVETLERL